jgi:hypothetical protein
MEVATIEKAASIAQAQIDKENASDPVVIRALKIVESFIKSNRVMCYGGTAINNLLPKEDRFYDPERDIPDYDFFSASPQIHAMQIADNLTDAGFTSVEVKPGVHMGTFKVFAEYIGVADVSHLDKPIFETLWKNSIEKEGIHYVPPNYLRMAVYLELSRPKGYVERWKKVYTRLQLLNKHYPMTCPQSQTEVSNIFLSTETQKKLENILIDEKAVLLGFNGLSLAKKNSKATWQLPLDVLITQELIEKTTKRFEDVLNKKGSVVAKKYPAYGELLPEHTDIEDKKTGLVLVRIYETTACHSYHKTSDGLLVASIPTLLQFFLSVLYAPDHFLEDIPEQRFLCAAQNLVELANEKSHARRYKLLTPITCLGKQKSLIDMRIEKSEIYEKFGKNKSSPEFLEYFFTYTPTSMDKTRRQKFRKDTIKTLKNHRK